MDRRAAWILGLVFGGLFLCLFAFMALAWIAIQGGRGGNVMARAGGDRVGVVEVTGVIGDAKTTLKELREFDEDPRIRAVVVRIDSPGGAVGPSQELFEAMKRLRAKKHVLASMGSIAASGGFYIAMGGEKVFANPGTLTGSIGVISEFPNVSGLLKWAGVEMRTITAGKLKDAGSPFREMSPEERSYFKDMLEDVHGQFIGAVAESRKLSEDEVRKVADGRVFTGRKAKELKLVDELGGLQDAVREAGKLAGMKGEPRMEYPTKDRPLFRAMFGDEAQSLVHALSMRVGEVLSAPGPRLLMPPPGSGEP
ncbi:MAG TPA: signal peptide peptidase SppA [Myxococcaceae bacterium]|jgi:protease-4|nr:signal peptide peptidase SppA [Myxococcaceae bacterium]